MDLRAYPILYVDDDDANRAAVKYNLGGEFSLRYAESGDEALQILSQEPIAVLLADHRMPGMTGVDLAERALKLYPDIVRVIVTAYADNETTIDAINRGQVNRFIKKPWTRDELAAVLRESVRAYHDKQLIKDLEQRLMQLDRMTSLAIMASALGHDLRQPLACVQSMVDVLTIHLSDLRAYPTADRFVQEKIEAVCDAAACIRDALDKFRLMADTLLKSLRSEEPHAALLELRQIVESAVAIARGTITKVARLQVEVPGEPVNLYGSEGRLLQLLVNLLLNAAQAIPHSSGMSHSVKITLSNTPNGACLKVTDTGCGIAPEHMPQIFTPFFTTKGSSGSGLGLPICKQIVEEMRGTIEVTSIPGRGTCVEVRLPREPTVTTS